MSLFFYFKNWYLYVIVYTITKFSNMAQKLSPKAAKAKAERDLRYAKTDDRRAKKAENQRMHRKHPGNNGKDYDHKDRKFKTVAANRGNDGEGTKKEGKVKEKVGSYKNKQKK